jgi:hypothetical protein
MERRELLTLGGLAALAALATTPGSAAETQGQGTPNWQNKKPDTPITIRRVYSDEKGESHFETMTLAEKLTPIPLTSLMAVNYTPAENSWHNAPGGSFAINLEGILEVETTDHTRHKVGPGDLVYLMDPIGKGHVTRILTPVKALFIFTDKRFDLVSWTKGGPAIPA